MLQGVPGAKKHSLQVAGLKAKGLGLFRKRSGEAAAGRGSYARARGPPCPWGLTHFLTGSSPCFISSRMAVGAV